MKKLSICICAGLLASVFLTGCQLLFALPSTPTPTPPPAMPTRTATPRQPTRIPTATWTPRPTVTPTLSPLPPFVGRLLLVIERDLYWLAGEGESAWLSEPLAQNIALAAVSPDGRYLAYSVRDHATTLMDLSSGEVQQISLSETSCFTWSPDSARFTYTVQGNALELYQADLAGSKVKIAQTPCKKYGGGVTGNIDPHSRCGELTCGAWLDESRLLFQRFQGEMPDFVTVGSGVPVQLQSQFTTLASLNLAAASLVDLPERWYEVERCSAGPYILLRKERDGSPYISATFTDFTEIQASPLPPCEDCYHGYLPQFSDSQCNILQRHHPSTGGDWFTLTDPASLEVILSTKDVFRVFNISYRNIAWVGDPQERILALNTFSMNSGTITLIDLHNGVEAVLFESGMEREQTYILAWIPP